MNDDFDVDAMLEAPYSKDSQANSQSIPKQNGVEEKTGDVDDKDKNGSRDRKHRSRSKDRDRRHRRSRSRRRSRERRRSRDRRRSRSRKRSRSHERRRRSRSRDRKRSRSKDRKRRSAEKSSRRRSRSRERKRRSKSKEEKREERKKSPSPLRVLENDLTPEERDARTVFCMQLSARVRSRDLENFFESVGKVKDVKLVSDTRTGRSKGIAYIEFRDTDSVPLALGLSGQKLHGIPIMVQPTQAEKNRQALASAAMSFMPRGASGPMRLYVGSLHFNITEEMLRGIFEPFGKIDDVQLMKDPENGRSKGFGFITFHDAEDAKKALEQLNGFELAGRPMKVGHVTERSDMIQSAIVMDPDGMDSTTMEISMPIYDKPSRLATPTGRLQLMSKLAEGTGMEMPVAAQTALNIQAIPMAQVPAPPIATQCFLLSNMFDPRGESSSNWEMEIRDDVLEECVKHGGAVHIFVDRSSPSGHVYVKCPNVSTAAATVNALHGRWFAGRMITAAYVPIINYHNLFPDSMHASQLLTSATRRL